MLVINPGRPDNYLVVSQSTDHRLVKSQAPRQVFKTNGSEQVTEINWLIESKEDGRILGRAFFVPPDWLYIQLPSRPSADIARMSALVLIEIARLKSQVEVNQ